MGRWERWDGGWELGYSRLLGKRGAHGGGEGLDRSLKNRAMGIYVFVRTLVDGWGWIGRLFFGGFAHFRGFC